MLVQARMLNNQAAALIFDEKLSERTMEELIEQPEVRLFDMHSRFSSDRWITINEKEKMLRYCRRHYASNPTQLKNIDDFERIYESKDALRWYSKDCFLFSSLNRCLRKQSGNVYDCDMVYFAVDLSIQIQLEWKKQREEKNVTPEIFHVYRGLNLPDTEVARIQNYRDKVITTKGFLSTTKSFAVAQMFAANVVFDIEIDPKLTNIVYADISAYSLIPDEKEILIDYGTSFRVKDIFDLDDNLWIVELENVNETDTIIDSFISMKRLQHEDDDLIATSLRFFGYTEHACRLLRQSIDSTSDNMQKFNLNCELGECYAQSREFMLAANHLQEAHRLGTLLCPYLSRLLSTTFWLAMMYACSNEHTRALDYLTIQLEFPDPMPYSFSQLRFHSWTYMVTNEESLQFDLYSVAYEHLQQCLTVHNQDENILYRIHFYLSLILLKCEREKITLQSLDKSLEHLKAAGRLGSDKCTDFLVLYYYYLGVVYESKECYRKGQRYYRKVLAILHGNHKQIKDCIIINVRVGACYTAQKMYTQAMQQYIRALQQSLTVGDIVLNGKMRAQLGITYLATRQYNEAVEQFIGISLLLGVSGAPFVHQIFLIIAETLSKLNDNNTALTYYSKFLDWHEKCKHSDFELWCNTCERIVYLYIATKQFEKSIIYAERMLGFRINNCPEDFDNIMNAQMTVAFCYQNNNEWQEAINHYNMAYDTLGKVTLITLMVEDYDPLISDQAVVIQSALAIIYQTIYDYDQAIFHANLALGTEKKRISRNKNTIASCYDFIGWCYCMKGEYDKALDFCTRGLHLLHTFITESDDRCCNIYHSLGTIWLKLGDLKQSYDYCIKAIRILSSDSDFQNKKSILAYFYVLLQRIREYADDTPQIPVSLAKSITIAETHKKSLLPSCIQSFQTTVQFKLLSNSTSQQTLLNTEDNLDKDNRSRNYDSLEGDIDCISAITKFEIVDSLDMGSSLHTIQFEEPEPLSPILYPMFIVEDTNQPSTDETNVTF
ncbi:unnamed protein product [Adineta steineri]|uniref:Cell division cycle protein 27 homolog n=1 Tax=Adineta steineri TaxID=433720 RepID=A0A815KIF8_9BILA|nr:unnamed protein product [Adineta steineri]CAF3978080.1 unnamed protein product [Adineta steineri]